MKLSKEIGASWLASRMQAILLHMVWGLVLSACSTSQSAAPTSTNQWVSFPSLTPSPIVSETLAVVETAENYLPTSSLTAFPTKPPVVPTEIPTTSVFSTLPTGWLMVSLPPRELFVIRTDGHGMRTILDDVQFPTSISVSPDGTWIALAGVLRMEENNNIFIVRPDGSDLRQVTSSDEGIVNYLSWSPDGKKIIYSLVGGPAGQPEADIFEVEIATQKISRLTETDEINEGHPVYLPDGETIAFLSVHLKDQPLVYSPMIMDSNGTNARPFGLFSTTDWIDFHWSPDGNQIVYSSGDDQRCGDDLFLINANGSDLRNVTKSPEHDTLPAWSPDGEWLAFISARCNDAGNTGFAQVYIVHVSGMGAMQITTRSNLTITGLTWLPNPALSIGKTYTVTNLGQAVNLRSDPSISGAVHRKLNAMERFSVMEGPVEADDYLWWWVKVGDDEYGWVAELPGWFAP